MSDHKRHRPRFRREQHVRIVSAEGSLNGTVLKVSGQMATVKFWDYIQPRHVPVRSIRPLR
jgi:hypothetical protein